MPAKTAQAPIRAAADDLPVRDLRGDITGDIVGGRDADIPQGITRVSVDDFGPTSGPATLAIDDVGPSPFNPRRNFDPAALQELADSLKQIGQKQRILVRPIEPRQHIYNPGTDRKKPDAWCVYRRTGGAIAGEPTATISGPTAEAEAAGLARILSHARYQIVAGERRWRAARLAGLATVEVDIESMDDRTAILVAVTENHQRRDVTAFEEARGFRALVDAGLSQKEIAEKIGCSQSRISKRLALISLPPDVVTLIEGGALEPSFGDRLQSFSDFPKVQVALANGAVAYGWPASSLEGSLSNEAVKVLKKARLAKEFDYDTEFRWREICLTNCPFGAYRSGQYGRSACLNPEHYVQLTREAQTRKIEEANAAAETALAKLGGKLPRGTTLALPSSPAPAPSAVSGDSEQTALPEPTPEKGTGGVPRPKGPQIPLLESFKANCRVIGIEGVGVKSNHAYSLPGGCTFQRPPGCDESTCPCTAGALHVPHGDVERAEIVAICTNPKRFEALRKTAMETEKAEKIASTTERIRQAEDVLAAAVAIGDPGSAVLTAVYAHGSERLGTRFMAPADAAALSAFAARLGVAGCPFGGSFDGLDRGPGVDLGSFLVKARASIPQMIAISAWLSLAQELSRVRDYGRSETRLLDMILRPAGDHQGKEGDGDASDSNETDDDEE